MSAQKYKVSNSNKTKSKKTLIIVLVIIILASVGGYFYFKKEQQNNSVKDNAQTSSAKTDIINQDKNTTIDPSDPSKPTDKVSDTTSDQVPVSTTTSIKITSVSQSGGRVVAVAETTGESSGKCVFSFTTPDDKPVVKEVTATNNKCEVNIPEVEFTKIGSWSLNVSYYAGDKKAEDTRDVTIN